MNIDTVFGYLFTSQTPLAQYSIDHALTAMSIVWCPICQHILIYTPGGFSQTQFGQNAGKYDFQNLNSEIPTFPPLGRSSPSLNMQISTIIAVSL